MRENANEKAGGRLPAFLQTGFPADASCTFTFRQ
jgi:hypothetical protein